VPEVDDHEVARVLVLEASRELLRLRDDVPPEYLALAVRRPAVTGLLEAIGRVRPADGLLSEHTRHDRGRLVRDRVWIVDPLNGIGQYVEPAGEDWGVHLALWQGGRLSAGAVALPARGLLLGTAPEPAAAPAPEPPAEATAPEEAVRTIAVQHERASALVERVAEQLHARLLRRRSTGATIAAVILGEADAYLDPAGYDEWDSAGPVAVALAAGIHASRLDGSPVAYNRPDAVLPDLLVCQHSVRARLLAAMQSDPGSAT
jgi:3'(2'), 5'-bisphosphate nucleotidase